VTTSPGRLALSSLAPLGAVGAAILGLRRRQ